MTSTSGVTVRDKRTGFLAHLSCIRYRDVLILQGSPLLGTAFAAHQLTGDEVVSMGVLALASLLLVAHVFSFNDWANVVLDSSNPNKSADVFVTRGVSRDGIVIFSLTLAAASLLLLALLPWHTFAIGLAIATLGALYSHPAFDAKGAPIVSSLPHLVGGALHFLLGYSALGGIDGRGALIAIFFGLTFAAGHLNQEVRDYESDRLNGIRTNAVAFGKTTAFVAGGMLFTLAYVNLLVLAWTGIVPVWLAMAPVVLYPVHVVWSVATWRAGLTFANVSRFQDRYRMLYAVIGVAMVATLLVR